ncbi:hypothetical protein [Candidatus Amarobacter glycogenicus]|uniref:hypothetical protein n=1 Tax=Candidatus Amarobacter glycogenicus TaxID=3140699 RepID=UPI002A157645|nr:hypothetical protein [Dehalococcoidia bacterium]
MARKPSNILLIILLALACIVSIAFTSALLDYFSGGSQTATPTPPPVLPPSDPWERIRSSGKIVVGSSLDYPPFSFYNDTFQPDGFDIALIREIWPGVRRSRRNQRHVKRMVVMARCNCSKSTSPSPPFPLRQNEKPCLIFSNIYFVSDDAILQPKTPTLPPSIPLPSWRRTASACSAPQFTNAGCKNRWSIRALCRPKDCKFTSKPVRRLRTCATAVSIWPLSIYRWPKRPWPPAACASSVRASQPAAIANALVNGAATTQAQINNALI